ncbi:MAG: murein biosynthesis integral membrane protein MurJ [Actinobacteria bacterium]|nr:murein biosynthesis integral membrane protein MurJ [Actinomycetota bacterium]MCL6104273.1 murein biosynthesis integral membrane protein MurJ [Actinomycetota bacterium]
MTSINPNTKTVWPSQPTFWMGVGTFIARLTGLARLFALAYALGINPLADAYNLANTTPHIVHDLVLGGILSATFVPIFVDRLTTKTDEEAWEAISAVITLSVVVLIISTVIFFLAAPGLITVYTLANHAKYAPLQRSVAVNLLRFFTPQLAFYGFVSLATALLNVKRHFAAPAFAPIVTNLGLIAVLLSIPHFLGHPTLNSIQHNSTVLLLLGLGTTLAVGAQLLLLLPGLKNAGLKIRWHFEPRHEAVLAVTRLAGWTFGVVAANQVSLFVMLFLADSLRGGSVSAYTYAWVFFQLPFGIVAASFMSTLTPELSELWSKNRFDEFRHLAARGIKAMISLILPAAVGYLVLGKPIIQLILGHGAAGTNGLYLTYGALAMLALGLPSFCIFIFLTRIYQTMRDTKTPFLLYLIQNIVNIVLAIALYHTLGVRGLTLSVSIAYTLATFIAIAHLGYRMGGIEGKTILAHLGRIAGFSFLMALCVALTTSLIVANHGWILLLRVIISTIVGIVVFFAAASVTAWFMSHIKQVK